MTGLRSLLLGSLAFVSVGAAQAAVLVPVAPVPNSTSTTVFGINGDNVLAGGFIGDDGVEHGFFGTNGSYTTFDAGQGGTQARGISDDGLITGFSNSQSGDVGAEPIFERKTDGTILSVTRTGIALAGSAQGFSNGDDKFAGTYWNPNIHQAIAFVGQNGKWRSDVTISDIHQASSARGMNSAGTVVGSYFRPPQHGFIVTDKVLTIVDYPAKRAIATELEGINDGGEAVGQWIDRKGLTHSFVLDTASNTFTDIKVRGAAEVKAWGINAAGAVALDTDIGAFIWCQHKSACPKGGTFVAAPVHRQKHR